ncbi:MAG: hypothetical protein ACE5J0_01030 [Candidatus Paceibacterales bacterium]
MELNQNPNLGNQPMAEQLETGQPATESLRAKRKYPLWKIGIGVLVIWSLVNTSLFIVLLSKTGKEPGLEKAQLAQVLQEPTTISEEVVTGGLQEKYQEIINQLAKLNQKEFNDPEVKDKIEKLSEEIYNLRVLHPYLRFKEIKTSFIPTGVPDVYGQELNISFDQVQDAINKVRVFGPTYGEEGGKIILTGADLARYIKIGSQTSCEYCCGATTLVREDGEAACGCAHSIMMRGLAAYLIKNHPELSDEQILKELNTWKITYFPKQTLSAKLQEMEKAGEAGIKELLEEFPDFLPQMVGGC